MDAEANFDAAEARKKDGIEGDGFGRVFVHGGKVHVRLQ
jgi:hypothetical protein